MVLTTMAIKWKWYEASLDFDVVDWKERLDRCKEHFGNASMARVS